MNIRLTFDGCLRSSARDSRCLTDTFAKSNKYLIENSTDGADGRFPHTKFTFSSYMRTEHGLNMGIYDVNCSV